jgi:hypothetical protein
MGLYTIAAEEVGSKLGKGLELVVVSGSMKKPATYPCVDHSDYFAIVVPNRDLTILEAKFDFKASKKVAFDEKGREEAFAKLRAYKFEEVFDKQADGTEKPESADKKYVFKTQNGYELVIEQDKFRLSRKLEHSYDSKTMAHFAKAVSAVFQTLLKRTEEIEEYGLTDQS